MRVGFPSSKFAVGCALASLMIPVIDSGPLASNAVTLLSLVKVQIITAPTISTNNTKNADKHPSFLRTATFAIGCPLCGHDC